MSKRAVKDVLDEMTREELISWIRSKHLFSGPKKSELLYIRWKRQSQEVIDEMNKENHSLDHLDFKERDRLAEKFNNSTCLNERLRLIEQIAPYSKAMSEHIKRSQAIDRKSKRVDALYEQIDVERRKESRS